MSNNPSAFPVNSANLGGPGAYEADPGMSLRDWFAGQALAGLAGTMHHWSASERAHRAYVDARAMLAERAKGSAS